MAKPVKYKRPRLINPVSVGLVVAFSLGAYVVYQYLPLFLQRQEVYRVVDETASKFSGSAARYLHSESELTKLKRELVKEIRRNGVSDPDLETWIESEPNSLEVRFGALYSAYLEWPFDLAERHEQINELEITCTRISIRRIWNCAASTQDSGQ